MDKFKIIISLSLLLLCACQSIENPIRPNIIMIMTDDLGWGDTGFNGNQEVQTPHLDRLASMGVIFDRFYSASPVCSPTRASFITGRNPLRMNIPGANSGHMPHDEITIAELLKTEDYATAHYGKWHLGTLSKDILDANRGGREKFKEHYTTPLEHGYDEFFCTESKVPTYDPLIKPIKYDEQESLRYGWKSIASGDSTSSYRTYYWKAPDVRETENLEGSNARIIMDRVLPFVRSSVESDRPFYTTIWFHTPHLPVVADEEHRAMYGDKSLEEQLYYGAITAMDEQVGRLWAALEMMGESENTVLWFCSDNGPENGTPGNAGVFRERKRSLYEGGVRVPSFVVGRGIPSKKGRVKTPTVTSDYLPSIVDMLDLPYPKDRVLDGVSMMPFISQEKTDREQGIGFVYGDYKKVSWVTDRYKYISTDEMKTFELYDLIVDPSESRDIIAQKPKIAATMHAEMQEWLLSVGHSARGEDY